MTVFGRSTRKRWSRFPLSAQAHKGLPRVNWSRPQKPALLSRLDCVGTWLSLVEHSLGVRGVGSSNLPVPTIIRLNGLEGFLSRGGCACAPTKRNPLDFVVRCRMIEAKFPEFIVVPVVDKNTDEHEPPETRAQPISRSTAVRMPKSTCTQKIPVSSPGRSGEEKPMTMKLLVPVQSRILNY